MRTSSRASLSKHAEISTSLRVFSSTLSVALVPAAMVLYFAVNPLPIGAQQMGAPTTDVSVIPRSINDTLDRVTIRDLRTAATSAQKTDPLTDTCLLPPLTFLHSPIVAATALAIPAKAKKDYLAACTALKEQKLETAEKHLRSAVEKYASYSAAWVTLGQLLAAENHTDEARGACSQGSAVEPNYLPAYLCLAGIAAQEKAWTDVLQFSGRALQIDPITTAISYEYSAAANLRINKLDEAERSALHALTIDKTHADPRVHFLLAQIYEAKGERGSEIVQLQEYLKLAKNPDDVATVNAYLSQIEKSPAAAAQSDLTRQKESGAPSSTSVVSVNQRMNSEEIGVAPSELHHSAPVADLSIGCNLDEVLPQVQHRIQEFVDNVQKFTATEFLEHDALNTAGEIARSEHQKYDYLVSIEESTPGVLGVSEYQNSHSSVETIHPDVVTKGLPALLLIFHPYYTGDFSLDCEGLTTLNGKAAWQIHFRQRDDRPNRIRSYRIGMTGPVYGINLEGRAWFLADTFQIAKLDADLVKPIPEIQLVVDHTSAEYGPVHFQTRGVDIWLPLTADLLCERKGKRFHERISFRDYLLFAVDNKQDIAPPKNQDCAPGAVPCPRQQWRDLRSIYSTARIGETPLLEPTDNPPEK